MMEVMGITYLFVALGAGLIGWQFLQSSLKVQKLGGPTTMGFLFSGIFLLLAVATGMIGLAQIVLGRILLAAAILFLTAASTLSLLLVRYTLFPKTSYQQILFLGSTAAIAGIMLGIFSSAPHQVFLFLFLLYVIALVPIFFIFNHHFLLARNQETKQKSFWLMVLMPLWLGNISLPLVFTPFLITSPWVNNLAMGALSILPLSFVLVSLLRFRIPKPKTSPAPPEIMGFLNSF